MDRSPAKGDNSLLFVVIVLSLFIGVAVGVLYQRTVTLRRELEEEKEREEEPDIIYHQPQYILPQRRYNPWPRRRRYYDGRPAK